MTRSYKKPFIKEGYGSKRKRQAKKAANKTVAQTEDIPDGGAYKKVSNSWDICDWVFPLPNTKKDRSK